MEVSMLEYRPESGWSSDLGSMDSEQTMVIVFGGSRNPGEEVLQELREAYGESVVLGCSTSGELRAEEVIDDSLQVAVVRFESCHLKLARAELAAASRSEEAGRELAEQLAGEGLRAVFVLSNGTTVNGTQLVAGVNQTLPDEVVVTGGLAGDGDAFERSWVFDGESSSASAVVAVGVYGEALRVSHGSRGGWDRFGVRRQITRSEDNVLYELDGEPALALYKKYLGEHADELPAAGLLFPLEIEPPGGQERRLVRTILSVDEEEQSLIFAGDMPEGAQAQLMKANLERLIDGAEDAALEATQMVEHQGPVLAMAVSCVGRRLVLRDRVEEEAEVVREALPDETTLLGFYSYGELTPSEEGRACDLHNQTMTITLWSERTASS